MSGWRDLQNDVSMLFMSVGCTAAVGARIDGARATHEIDVWVTFEQFGFPARWAVECKHWDANISKEVVAAHKFIVDDVGADRGLIVATSSFQPGAIAAASISNITLIEFNRLKELIDTVLAEVGTRAIEDRVRRLSGRIMGLWVLAKEDVVMKDGKVVGRSGEYRARMPDPERLLTKALGQLVMVTHAMQQCRDGHLPVSVPGTIGDDVMVRRYSRSDACLAAISFVDVVDTQVRHWEAQAP